jgi:hypothetical protein
MGFATYSKRRWRAGLTIGGAVLRRQQKPDGVGLPDHQLETFGKRRKVDPLMPLIYSDIVFRQFGGSSNGRTADSDSASLGSNPSPPATVITYKIALAPKSWRVSWAFSWTILFSFRPISEWHFPPTQDRGASNARSISTLLSIRCAQ